MITINGKEYKVKYTVRALFIWEQLEEKPFEIKTNMDNFVLYYSILLASNRDSNLTFDEFIEEIDNHPEIISEITEELSKSQSFNSQFNNKSEGEDEKKA